MNDSLAARQLYARHLYILALSLSDTGAVLNDLSKTNPTASSDDVTRFLAQWAVNVVAYRDHNNIMIPFAYDANPFTTAGWHPDGTAQHTVWGCKRPSLLITETIAFHDRRTQDLSSETVNNNKPNGPYPSAPNPNRTQAGLTTDITPKSVDPGYNSAYRPQGSLFVEFFNPSPAMEPQLPDLGPSQLSPPSAQGRPGVELTKTVGANRTGSPVWRLIVVDPTKNQAPANGDEVPDPDYPVTTSRPIIERVAYFVPLTNLRPGTDYPLTDDRGNKVLSYYPSTTNLPGTQSLVVAPGGYAVVGSGDPGQGNYTYIGFPSSGQPPAYPATPPPTARWITMNQSDVTSADPRVLRSTVDTIPYANPPQVLGIDQAAPNGNNGGAQRLSVSEPTKGYAYYEHQPTGNGNNNGAAVSYTAGSGKYGSTLDIPVDEQRSMVDNEVWGTTPIWKILNTKGTTSGFRIIYLQRLADPTRPWVAEAPAGTANPINCNPYRTVDSMAVDLTCFNGVANEPNGSKDPPVTTNAFFASHQRGEKNYLPGNPPAPPNTVGEANVWKQEPASRLAEAAGNELDTGGLYRRRHGHGVKLRHASAQRDFGLPEPAVRNAGQRNERRLGDPQYPFPVLNWAYRPFNNVYELLLVPTVSSSRLLARNTNVSSRGYYGYVDENERSQMEPQPANYQPLPVYDGNPQQVPYPHLLNFFESNKSSTSGLSAQFHRLLYYLGVPSRFSNAQLQMRADVAGQYPSNPAHWFHFPFNRISRYREPGMINLNTVTSPDVLFGATNDYSPLQVNGQLNAIFWDKFVRSRRGNPATTSGGSVSTSTPTVGTLQQSMTNMLTINPNSPAPSRFMRPYRTPGGAFLTASGEPPRETDVTFLRGDPEQPEAERPLFEMDDYLLYSMNNTAAPPTNTSPDKFPLACMDYNRSANFRYQLMQKLGSTASTHSNVFAIWITVGYFEALPAANGVGPGNPDGWQVGQELGADTGDVTRHRAFFIFDRSLPVGFFRGQDINTDKAFLLKRFIE